MDLPEPPSPAIDPELLENAARIGLSVEGLSERDLRLRLQKLDPEGAEARARRWAEENAEAIRLNNEAIKRRGVFGADLRRW
jgi:antitoxin CcdA